jgi:2-polyprenyl-6-methoxyphenol hydroxylase-like FAD-dependent oxidoreductase
LELKTINTEVLIVGAGPVGLLTANFLLKEGIDCILLERRPKGTHSSHAICLHHRTIDLLARLRLHKNLHSTANIIRSIQIHTSSRKIYDLPLKEMETSNNYILNLEESHVETLLLEHLQNKQGKLHFETEVIDFQQKEDYIQLSAIDPSGCLICYKTKYLIGCDGINSIVRYLSGIEKEITSDSYAITVIDCQLECDLAEQSWHSFPFKKGYLLAYPLGHKKWRMLSNVPIEGNSIQEAVENLLHQAKFQKCETLSIKQTRRVELQNYICRDFHKGNIFLAGDAAHMHFPHGNQGMNAGLMDAANLSWKLISKIRGKFSDLIFQTYDLERKQAAEEIDWYTRNVHSIMEPKGFLHQRFRKKTLQGITHIRFFRKKFLKKVSPQETYSISSKFMRKTISKRPELLNRKNIRCMKPGGQYATNATVIHPRTGIPLKLSKLLEKQRFIFLILTSHNANSEEVRLIKEGIELVKHKVGDDMLPLVICGRNIPKGLDYEQHSCYLDPRYSIWKTALGKYGSILSGDHHTAFYIVRPDQYICMRCYPANIKILDSYVNTLFAAKN